MSEVVNGFAGVQSPESHDHTAICITGFAGSVLSVSNQVTDCTHHHPPLQLATRVRCPALYAIIYTCQIESPAGATTVMFHKAFIFRFGLGHELKLGAISNTSFSV